MLRIWKSVGLLRKRPSWSMNIEIRQHYYRARYCMNGSTNNTRVFPTLLTNTWRHYKNLRQYAAHLPWHW